MSGNQDSTEQKSGKQRTVTFSHRFLSASYENIAGKKVDFVNGTFKTDDPEVIKALRDHDDMGGELAEVE